MLVVGRGDDIDIVEPLSLDVLPFIIPSIGFIVISCLSAHYVKKLQRTEGKSFPLEYPPAMQKALNLGKSLVCLCSPSNQGSANYDTHANPAHGQIPYSE